MVRSGRIVKSSAR